VFLTLLWHPKLEICQKYLIPLLGIGSSARIVFCAGMIGNVKSVLVVKSAWYILPLFYDTSIGCSYLLQLVMWGEMYNSIRKGKLRALNIERARIVFVSLCSILVCINFAVVPPYILLPEKMKVISGTVLGIFALEIIVIAGGFLTFGIKTTIELKSLSVLRPLRKSRTSKFEKVTYFLLWTSFIFFGDLAVTTQSLAREGYNTPDTNWIIGGYFVATIEFITVGSITLNYFFNVWQFRPEYLKEISLTPKLTSPKEASYSFDEDENTKQNSKEEEEEPTHQPNICEI